MVGGRHHGWMDGWLRRYTDEWRGAGEWVNDHRMFFSPMSDETRPTDWTRGCPAFL